MRNVIHRVVGKNCPPPPPRKKVTVKMFGAFDQNLLVGTDVINNSSQNFGNGAEV